MGRPSAVRKLKLASTCPSRKIQYQTQLDANRAALTIWKKKRDAQRHPVRSYRCPRCELWHLTSQREKPQDK